MERFLFDQGPLLSHIVTPVVVDAPLVLLFERCVALYEVLVQGRNLKNRPPMQQLLPYSVVTALITDSKLQASHLGP